MRPHDLRHTHVALLIAAGEDPYVISHRLGHASIRTTPEPYGHLFPGLDEAAADALDASVCGLVWGWRLWAISDNTYIDGKSPALQRRISQ